MLISTMNLIPGSSYTISLLVQSALSSSLVQQTITIARSGVKALIKGGNRTAYRNQADFLIDGSASYDMDYVGITAGLSFEWTCAVGNGPCRYLNGSKLILPYVPYLNLNLYSLNLQGTSALQITLMVSKGAYFDSQTVILELSDAPVLPVEISSSVNNQLWVSLKAVPVTNNAKYSWNVKDSANNLMNQVLTKNNACPAGIDSYDLVILNPSKFLPRGKYAISVEMRYDNLVGTASIPFRVTWPPSGGQCAVSPTSGVELEQDFQIKCISWTSDDLPLSYQYGLGRIGSAEISWTPQSYLNVHSAILTNGDYGMVASIIDNLGGASLSETTNIRVRQKEFANGTNFEDELFANIAKAIDQFNSLGLLGQSLQLSNSALLSLQENQNRRLLASSLAYRMRVRNMLLAKMAGGTVNDKMNTRTMSSSLETVSNALQQPSEISPNGCSDVGQLLGTCTTFMTVDFLRGDGIFAFLSSFDAYLITAKNFDKPMRQASLISVLNNVLNASTLLSTSMVQTEQAFHQALAMFTVQVQRCGVDLSQEEVNLMEQRVSVDFGAFRALSNLRSQDLSITLVHTKEFWFLDDLYNLGYTVVSNPSVLYYLYSLPDLKMVWDCKGSDSPCFSVQVDMNRSTAEQAHDLLLKCVLWNAQSAAWDFKACTLGSISLQAESATAQCLCNSVGSALVIQENLDASGFFNINNKFNLHHIFEWLLLTIIVHFCVATFVVVVTFRGTLNSILSSSSLNTGRPHHRRASDRKMLFLEYEIKGELGMLQHVKEPGGQEEEEHRRSSPAEHNSVSCTCCKLNRQTVKFSTQDAAGSHAVSSSPSQWFEECQVVSSPHTVVERRQRMTLRFRKSQVAEPVMLSE
ncbi:hypothetical protein GUITHDRAFT_112722 [Guillardia theta CCMP2712]|uniref:PKD/REJ-like domain-containing protein n=1 Tax=Guillardia theta (strain CCMP2712) TaxID=905079 RepID=L1IYU3_GUITC|nr:hypothetical protein GUITHDRAFT_112722 [Guillardia theta CCMP2712]EKX41257.1 hypothetical protein GUITHDRAFT_112722 [Guillardia theta CCMP2712]|eukprot:XP_005828237.1 hypothetical protein GUITHDRAFT_112722 [Guillardia theta CCMP2712]